MAYEPDQVEPDVLAIGQGVKRAFEEVLVPEGMGDVAIYTELGRWLLGPAGALVTRRFAPKRDVPPLPRRRRVCGKPYASCNL